MPTLDDIIPYDDVDFLKEHAKFLRTYNEKQRIRIILLEAIVKELEKKLKDEKKSNKTKEDKGTI